MSAAHYAGKTAYQGGIAASYDRDRIGEPVWQQEQAWMEAWARAIPAGARVLDLPAGTGRFIGILRARGARVHAVDISEDMLAELRRAWPEAGDELVVERADAEALPYAADTFDYVVCWRLMHLLPPGIDERILRELARVCRGRIVLEVFGVEPVSALRAFWRRLRNRWRPAAPAGPWSHITSYARREQELQRLFARCGLQVRAAETLALYHGNAARIYTLARREEGK